MLKLDFVQTDSGWRAQCGCLVLSDDYPSLNELRKNFKLIIANPKEGTPRRQYRIADYKLRDGRIQYQVVARQDGVRVLSEKIDSFDQAVETVEPAVYFDI